MTAKRFWLNSLTWGVIMSTIGLLAAVVLIATAHKPKLFGYAIYFEVGSGWGGVNLGPIFIVNKKPTDHTLHHEYGHAFQNCVWGVLFPFVIAIPSFLRYQKRKRILENNPNADLEPYDAVWYEAQATEWGYNYSPLR